MNAPVAASVLREVEQHLAQALALLDQHQLGLVAAPHIDFGLSYVRDALTELSSRLPERSAG
ncbi:hypothetical protein [Sphingomonas sp. MMS24-J13]|uniref:hypothetical protein n=1 Tax=Sphingomonas sp. MMS24-J13 TaxID=3238686 RepID=UPI00384E61C4